MEEYKVKGYTIQITSPWGNPERVHFSFTDKDGKWSNDETPLLFNTIECRPSVANALLDLIKDI